MTTGSYSAGIQIGSTTNTLSGNPGMVAIKEATFTTAATCPMYDVFSREFASYHILFHLRTSGASGYFGLRLMSRNVVDSTPIYGNSNQFVIYTGGWGSIGNAGFSEFLIGYTNGAGTIASGNVNIHQPYNVASRTMADWYSDAADLYTIVGAGIYDAATRSSGFSVYHLSGGTSTGYIAVYGIRSL